MNSTSSPQVEDKEAIDAALCRAALYSALAIGFQAPTDDHLARLLSTESRVALAGAIGTLYPSGETDLVSPIEALSPGAAAATGLSTRYRALFGHAAGGPVPPYETEYGNEALFQQPQELADLMGFYRAFGLQVKADRRERADHVSCECEFMMFLALKEAYALTHGDREMLEETRRAQKLFLRDHLARFFPTFTARLKREGEADFYATLAEFGSRWVSAECARLEVAPGPASLALRPADDTRVPMACGSGAEGGAMGGACPPEEGDSL